MKVQKFWMVHGIGQRSPTFRHETHESAKAEAERLAQQCPGTVFVVLAAKDAFCARIQPVGAVEIVKNAANGATITPDDPIPF